MSTYEKSDEVGAVHSSAKRRKTTVWENTSYVWEVKNFSSLKSRRSQEFKAAKKSKCGWKMFLYPFGKEHKRKNVIGLYFHLAFSHSPIFHDSVFAHGSLSLQDSTGNTIHEKYFQTNLHTKEKYGWPEFVDKNLVLSRINRDGLLKVHIEIASMVDELERCHVIKPTFMDTKLKDAYSSMLENGKFCDIAFLVDGEKINAHRCVLSERSSVFSAMFAHNVLENASGEINVSDFTADVIRALLHFIYTGRTDIRDLGMGMHLIRAADKYDIEDLKITCTDYLMTKINSVDVVDILLCADTYNSEDLKKNAMDYIVENFSQKEEFKKIEEKNPTLLTELYLLKGKHPKDENDMLLDSGDKLCTEVDNLSRKSFEFNETSNSLYLEPYGFVNAPSDQFQFSDDDNTDYSD